MELRLVLEIESAEDGSLSGAMISVDQGSVRIPVTTLIESSGAVRFEASAIRAAFDGVMSANGSEVSGQWLETRSALVRALVRR
jgi:hypothetical protein